MLDDFELEKLVEPLQNWFLANARVLPWRDNPSPYYVWVSEIMLQQTRVEAVKPYFERFIRELPDIKALAECSEDKLLKLWEGLGYYNRVRNLNIAAKEIMEHYEGKMPDSFAELLKLKGIGHYTAGAISSIAFGKRVPAVDGNVLRVISRVTGDDSDIMKQSVRSHMEEKLLQLMEGNQAVSPSVFNQALMELGAMVCLPNGEPHCEECPWNLYCQAKAMNRIDQLPVKTKAKERRVEERTVFVIREGNKVAVRKRPARGLLAGLYELPNELGYLKREEIIAYVRAMGFSPIRIQELSDGKHIFSHVEWRMKGYAVFVEPLGFTEEGTQVEDKNLLFVEAVDARERYAIPTAFARYAAYMNIALGIKD